jgi:hypothetical protein
MADFSYVVYRELAMEVIDAVDNDLPGANKFSKLLKRLRKERVDYLYAQLTTFPSALETLARICEGKVGPTPLAVKLQDMKLIEPVGNGNGNWIATVLGYDVHRHKQDLAASARLDSKKEGG